jgi:hypothetical protein
VAWRAGASLIIPCRAAAPEIRKSALWRTWGPPSLPRMTLALNVFLILPAGASPISSPLMFNPMLDPRPGRGAWGVGRCVSRRGVIARCVGDAVRSCRSPCRGLRWRLRGAPWLVPRRVGSPPRQHGAAGSEVRLLVKKNLVKGVKQLRESGASKKSAVAGPYGQDLDGRAGDRPRMGG